jgi:hypothetical protein
MPVRNIVSLPLYLRIHHSQAIIMKETLGTSSHPLPPSPSRNRIKPLMLLANLSIRNFNFHLFSPLSKTPIAQTDALPYPPSTLKSIHDHRPIPAQIHAQTTLHQPNHLCPHILSPLRMMRKPVQMISKPILLDFPPTSILISIPTPSTPLIPILLSPMV